MRRYRRGGDPPCCRRRAGTWRGEADTVGKVIAIVDDDGSALAAIAGLVRALGFAVAPYSDPEAFLLSGTAAEVICLIVDMQMPRMTGLELYRRLVADGTPLPTILMTAYPDDMTRRRAQDAGVDGFLTKPLRPDALAAGIRAALSRRGMGGADPKPTRGDRHMATITTQDGTEIYYKDWGTGQPVVFSHGWPLTADAWDSQMLFLGSKGYRVIAHDRRGHGRSSQSWNGNDMDTYADDLAALTAALDLKDAVHVGHSTGGGEVARYIGRHGTGRVAKAVLIGAVPPIMLKTDAYPGGLPMDVFDGIRAAVLADRSQFFKDLTTPFYGANRPDAKISQGMRDSFWLQGMQAGFKNVYDCIEAFSATDFTEDLKKFDVPTLIVHGDDDQIVPIAASAHETVKLVKDATLKVYPGASHALAETRRDQLNADLLAFIQA